LVGVTVRVGVTVGLKLGVGVTVGLKLGVGVTVILGVGVNTTTFSLAHSLRLLDTLSTTRYVL